MLLSRAGCVNNYYRKTCNGNEIECRQLVELNRVVNGSENQLLGVRIGLPGFSLNSCKQVESEIR
jgi:hypothetical protein